jgi:hypothetical protein
MTAYTRIRPARQVADSETGRRRRAAEPVFLDRTGRRRRIVVAAGATAALLLTLVMLALLAGLRSVGPGVLPGWPAADGHARPAGHGPDRTGSSPSAATKATAPVRFSVPAPPPAPTTLRRSAAPTVTTPPTAASAAPTTSATTPGNGRGRDTSHTPNPHSSKKP